MANPIRSLPLWLYERAVIIWKHCGNEEFLASYLENTTVFSWWGAWLRELESNGMVSKVGRIYPGATTSKWKIKPKAAEKLIKLVGPVDESAEKECQAYTRERITELKRRAYEMQKMRLKLKPKPEPKPKVETKKEMLKKQTRESRERQVAECLQVIIKNYAPGDVFKYHDVRELLTLRNTQILHWVEPTGIIERAGSAKSCGTCGYDVQLWRRV